MRGTTTQFRGYLGESLMNPRRNVSTCRRIQAAGGWHIAPEGRFCHFFDFFKAEVTIIPPPNGFYVQAGFSKEKRHAGIKVGDITIPTSL